MLCARLQLLLLCWVSLCHRIQAQEEGQVLLLVPSVVNVSEGQVAVVCFQADFNTILRGDGENFQLNLTLAVVNVETTSDDYEVGSVPSNLLLNDFQPTQCLQIPTFNNTEELTSSESFRINVTAVTSVPPFLPVATPDGSSVLVTLFERCVNGDVRLVGGDNTLEGRVQMCFNGVFGFVCDTDGWTQEEADVVCTQLGNIAIPDFERHDTLSISGPLNADDFIIPGRFSCPEEATNLLQCIVNEPLPQVCSPNSGVQCFANRVDSCSDGAVRLVGANATNSSGRVEVCYRSMWGTVCGDRWDAPDAAVVCRDLGVPEGDVPPLALSNSEFGAGSESMPIWLDEVMCQGAEGSLLDCPRLPFGVNDCSHIQDAGVDCSPVVQPTPSVPVPPVTTEQVFTTAAISTTEEAPLSTAAISTTEEVPLSTAAISTTEEVPLSTAAISTTEIPTTTTEEAMPTVPPFTTAPTMPPVTLPETTAPPEELGTCYSDGQCMPTLDVEVTGPITLEECCSRLSGESFRFEGSEVCLPCEGRVLLVECYRELNCDGPFSMVTVEACCTVQERQSYVFQGQERCLSCLLEPQVCPPDETVIQDFVVLWPPTPAGLTITEQCPFSDADISRECSQQGVWLEPDASNCEIEELVCPLDATVIQDSIVEWPPTPAGMTITEACPFQFSDEEISRECSERGVWLEPDTSNCEIIDRSSCPRDETPLTGGTVVWPPTRAGQTAFQPCPLSEALVQRQCSMDGEWSFPDQTSCELGCGPNELACSGFERERCFNRDYICDGIPDCIDGFRFPIEAVDELGCPAVPCVHGEVRPLLGGASPNEGVLEVCFLGTFLPVSFDGLTISEASVMCTQLNLSAAGFPLSASVDLEIPNVFFDNDIQLQAVIRCDGAEQNITSCNFAAIAALPNFAGIQCIDRVACVDGDERLVNEFQQTGEGVREGRLEICYQGVWGAVYDTDWSAQDAAVTCQDLGFDPRGALPLVSVVSSTDPRVLPISYDCPECSVIANTTLLECPRTQFSQETIVFGRLSQSIPNKNALNYLVGVSCRDVPDTGCQDGDVRLTYQQQGGAVGNVEICFQNQWQAACNQFFNQAALNVTCRFLGFDEYQNSPFGHMFNLDPIINASIPVFEEFLSCSGTESGLSECLFINRRKRQTACSPDEVVRITCQSRPEILFEPPLRTEILFVEEGRRAPISNCSVNNAFTFPTSDLFPGVSVLTSPSPPPLSPPPPNQPLRKRRDTSMEAVIRVPLTFTGSASERDSGDYNCTAVNGGSFFPEGLAVVLGPSAVATTKNLQVVVLGFNEEEEMSLQFLRFSVISFDRVEEILGELQRDMDLEREFETLILDSINSNLRGRQMVGCEEIDRREFDDSRGLDRYQCIIYQASDMLDETQASVSVAEVLEIFPRLSSFTIVDLANAADGFCDIEPTQLLDSLLLWPETAVRSTATVPCPFSSGSATRQCASEGDWLQPDISECVVDLCPSGQFFCESESGRCVNEDFRCDGIPDCIQLATDGSANIIPADELNCPNPVCRRGDIRPLTFGSSPSMGIVEVCLGERFLPVRQSDFTVAEANVICRQLDLGSAGFPIDGSSGLGVGSDQVLTSAGGVSIDCTGSEESVGQCDVAMLESQFQAAAVQCIERSECSDGDERLVNEFQQTGEGVREGRLEICYQGVWGAVYDTDWSAQDAAVTCQDLGFEPEGALPLVSVVYESDPRNLPIVYDCPACDTIFNTTLLECRRISPFFFQDEVADLTGVLGDLVSSVVGPDALRGVVGVVCEDYSNPECAQFETRLTFREQGGAVGNLQICINNTWLAICGNSPSGNVLPVACQALGFNDIPTQLARRIPATIDLVNQSAFGDRLSCAGDEDSLMECQFVEIEGSSEFFCTRPSDIIRIQCPTLPRILLDPPVLTDDVRVDVGTNAQLTCIVNNDITFPPVFELQVSGNTLPPEFEGPRKRSVFSNEFVRRLYSTESARIEDSGNYSCTALSSVLLDDIIPGDQLPQNDPGTRERRGDPGVAPGEGIVFTTTRNITLIVEAPIPGDGVVEYLRLSGVTVERLEQLDSFFFRTTRDFLLQGLESTIFDGISSDFPGQQNVSCAFVAMRVFEVERGLDRFQCTIVTTSASSSVSIDDFSPAQAAIRVLQRVGILASINISNVGFCDADPTEFEGSTLLWPESEVGVEAVVQCPTTTGAATRVCESAGVWAAPDTTACINVPAVIGELTTMLSIENITEQVVVFTETLAVTLNNTMMQTPEVLNMSAEYFEGVAEVFRTSPGTPIPPMVVSSLVADLNVIQQWNSTVTSSTSDTSRIILNFEFVVETFAQQLQVSILVNFTEGLDMTIMITLVAESFRLDDLLENGSSITFGDGGFTSEAAGNLPEDAVASVDLPPELFTNVSRDPVGVFFALYSEPTLFPVRQPERTENDTSSLRSEVASSVVASTVGPGLDFSSIDPPVVINLRLSDLTIDRENASMRPGSQLCVSWDFTAAGGQGDWTSVGCVTRTTNDPNVTRCECNHLTNFAVLVDICTRADESCENNQLAETILSVISYIGASISLIALVITVFTLLYFKKMRARDASKYHVQLSIAIFLMLLVFVSGVDKTSRYGGCVLVSVLIHYFSLAAVMWMGAEAVLMFHKLVFVFKRVTKRGIIITSIICWTVPLVPVLIPLIIDLAGGNDRNNDLVISRGDPDDDSDADGFCFLSNTIVFFVAFLGPIFAIIIFNVVVYIVVIAILVKHTRGTMARKKESLNTKTLIRLMVSIAGVMFLFGLSWLFGALTITVQEVRLTFQVLFAVFTSLQGFFIFLFFCVFSREARELWKETLSCGRYQSTFLNPNLKFSSTTGTAEKYRTPKNGGSAGTSQFGSKNTQESSVTTFQAPLSSSTENIIDSRPSSPGDRSQELPSKVDLSKAPQDFVSVAEEDEVVAETDVDGDVIDVVTAELTTTATAGATPHVQADLEAGDFAKSVMAEIETASEEVRVKFP